MRDGSGNPLWNEVEQRLQRTARPEVFTKGHAQINKSTNYQINYSSTTS